MFIPFRPGPEDDSDLGGELEDTDGPVSFDADEFGDQVPMLSRNAPGRRSMSERRHTSLDAKKSEFYNQLQEKKKGEFHTMRAGVRACGLAGVRACVCRILL